MIYFFLWWRNQARLAVVFTPAPVPSSIAPELHSARFPIFVSLKVSLPSPCLL
jgi:hypothetical protein